MRYICSADWHVRSTTPAYRKDDYESTILRKISFMVATANKYNAVLLCAGDIFHNTKVEYRTFNQLSAILQRCERGVLTVPGQHDMEYHKEDDLDASPYQTLIDTGAIHDISNTTSSSVYGLPWNANSNGMVPNDSIPIMLAHLCVTPIRPPFFLKDSAISSIKALKTYKNFDFIISGDYHSSHKRSHNGRLLLNCGSIGRSNKDQIAHTPACFLIDTEKPGKVKRIRLPFKPAEDVFTKAAFIEKKPEDKSDHTEQIQELADLLKDAKRKPDFKNTVQFVMSKREAPQRQTRYAQEIFRRLQNVE